ncbi:hypothetical protein Glove_275g94 [Diversispora epigaea]|uniref:Uncharacterized protein n=1 Tax=Diversispora epigaea TaxID=1348612 RepID=A0A397I8K3_9GLOM|nr:hypothetical protein Glove_275g94 [Diversispora epigaea]
MSFMVKKMQPCYGDLLTRHKKIKNIENLPRSGWPPALNNDEKNKLINEVTKNRTTAKQTPYDAEIHSRVAEKAFYVRKACFCFNIFMEVFQLQIIPTALFDRSRTRSDIENPFITFHEDDNSYEGDDDDADSYEDDDDDDADEDDGDDYEDDDYEDDDN